MPKKPWPFFHLQQIIAAAKVMQQSWSSRYFWRVIPVACLLIFCCLIIIGILSYSADSNRRTKWPANLKNHTTEQTYQVNIVNKPLNKTVVNRPVINNPDINKPAIKNSAVKTENTAAKLAPSDQSESKHKYEQPIWPLNGKIVVNMDWNLHPVYKDWRFHPGIDISADGNEEVKAILSGQVTRIYTDSKTGLTVVIKCGEYDIIYGSLSEAFVIPQAHVRQLQPLGRTGQFQAEPYCHLHFAVKRNNQYIDPQKLLK